MTGCMASSPHQSALSAAIRTLAASRVPGCILDGAGTFLFVNEAWENLPAEAGGPGGAGGPLVGTRFADTMPPGPFRGACAAAVDDVLAARGPSPRVLTSEWNDQRSARLVSTRLEPLVAGGDVIGLVLQRSIVRERPIGDVYELEDLGDDAYRDAVGSIAQCACCRRVRAEADPERWDFVPRLTARPRDAASALCPLCAELHVGALSCATAADDLVRGG
jgi:hypothetical protein